MLLRDNSTSKVYWVQNYTIEAIEEAGYVDIDVSGRYYNPDYDYITITTSPPLRIYDDYPSEGVLIITGNTGTAGGPTRARLIAESSTKFRVQVDTDGDDLYDDYDSGILNW